jgi:four helix bundle protein
MKSFEDLEIWKLSSEVALEIYKITNNEKFNKDYGLKEQIRRAVISISSNIVEGFERNGNNEFTHFLRIAKGSTGEVRSQLYIASKLSISMNQNILSFLKN